MQTLSRLAIIGGAVLASLANIMIFIDVDNLDDSARINLCKDIYLFTLAVPALSFAGAILFLSSVDILWLT